MSGQGVVCLGEALAVLDAVGDRTWRAGVGGAEANVAWGLAVLGVPATFVTRLGADPFGDLVQADLTAAGVRVLGARDEVRPTGAYVKTAASRMHYYRSGSAASAMCADLLDRPDVAEALAQCAVVHTSGITAGVLADDTLLHRLVGERDRLGFTLCVDLNWRPALWHGRDHDALVDLLSLADVVLLGADEALAALGTADVAGLRSRLGPRPRLVLKSDAHEATEVEPSGASTTVPALSVDVVEPIGAGDGFAAGYLTGLVEGLDPAERLGLGHRVAASVLTHRGDHLLEDPR
ncbi:sugar kinase [Nocardioides mangrovicus]|nr:sugar kinase [Nocardioides mangrovicus]